MTIHSDHPFLDHDRDQARRLRGRLGGAVSLVTTHDAGLTVSSLMIGLGEPARLFLLLDPDADLTDDLRDTGAGVVQLLTWRHRDLAEAFAGQAPAPGGPFRLGDWIDTPAGRRLADAPTWASFEVEDVREAGWSLLVTGRLGSIEVGDDADALEHRRGRYGRTGRDD
ncbi:MAG: flavin reductase [Myxococcales bacterium]|nr:MAG: flavin reductase [Myxococcales bacterium]